jgi:hypothetical protein
MAAQCGEHPGRCRAAGHLLSCVEV